ncbi:MAG TPA: FtsX-like permease family protein [Arenimonas sp.]|uniref:ABC transporter permease n=1 Tax=Arenimonas sp. TaxID=1872635 RepID=UPI002D8084E7|nr:FtsX-like permease family protein [Arenimonas sp.]HEU0153635.1 FtsX-like permease family protein [Arenimonas sp.]
MEIRPILSALLRSKTGALLIAAQVALTLAILGNAVYIVQERLAISARPTGVDEDNLFFIRLYGFREGIDVQAMLDTDLATLRALPGVASVATANMAPLTQSGWNLSVQPNSNDPAVDSTNTAFYFSSEDLVDTLGLKLVEGRYFTPDEVQVIEPSLANVDPRHVVLTQALARQLFPDATSYVGKAVYLGDSRMEVVGVVERLQSPWAQLGDAAERSMIVPMRQLDPAAQYLVRAEPGQLDRVMREVEDTLVAARDDRVLLRNTSLKDARANRYRADRSLAWMLVTVMGLLVLVTASGIVGMASLWVNQRRKQIGVRRAIGARQRDILRYFLVENFMVTSFGIAIGLGLALGLNQLLVSTLEVSRLPLAILPAGVLGLWTLGLLAALGPAWRAARIPPAEATRSV